MVSLKEVEDFFFSAMATGSWAAGGKATTISDLPGFKVIPVRQGDFYLLDYYSLTPGSRRSAGSVTIWWQGIPVWIMHFGGEYPREAIHLVKTALMEAYTNRLFMGGRGVTSLSDPIFAYTNVPRKRDFADFAGREFVRLLATGEQVGWHNYWGMSLIS